MMADLNDDGKNEIVALQVMAVLQRWSFSLRLFHPPEA